MTHHSVMTSSLRIQNFKIDKFGDFSSDIDFKTKMDIFRDDISLIINQCQPQATEGSLWRIRSVHKPRSASKRSALVVRKYINEVFMKCQIRFSDKNMLYFKSFYKYFDDIINKCQMMCFVW